MSKIDSITFSLHVFYTKILIYTYNEESIYDMYIQWRDYIYVKWSKMSIFSMKSRKWDCRHTLFMVDKKIFLIILDFLTSLVINDQLSLWQQCCHCALILQFISARLATESWITFAAAPFLNLRKCFLREFHNGLYYLLARR